MDERATANSTGNCTAAPVDLVGGGGPEVRESMSGATADRPAYSGPDPSSRTALEPRNPPHVVAMTSENEDARRRSVPIASSLLSRCVSPLREGGGGSAGRRAQWGCSPARVTSSPRLQARASPSDQGAPSAFRPTSARVGLCAGHLRRHPDPF